MLECFKPSKQKLEETVRDARAGLPPVPALQKQLMTKWDGYKYLFHHGIVKFPDMCPKCGGAVSYKKDGNMVRVNCRL